VMSFMVRRCAIVGVCKMPVDDKRSLAMLVKQRWIPYWRKEGQCHALINGMEWNVNVFHNHNTSRVQQVASSRNIISTSFAF
jgi:hypothetical protein